MYIYIYIYIHVHIHIQQPLCLSNFVASDTGGWGAGEGAGRRTGSLQVATAHVVAGVIGIYRYTRNVYSYKQSYFYRYIYIYIW